MCGQRSFQFSAVFHGKPFKDNQVSNVYLLWLDRDAEEFTLQKEEISAVRWMPLADCLRNVENGALNSCNFPRRAANGAGHGGKGKRNLIEEIILWESCRKRPSLSFLFCRVTTRAIFDVFDREGTGKPNAGSCFPPIYELTFKVYLKAKEMTNTSRILRLQKQTIFSTFQMHPGKMPKVFA